MSSNQLPKSLPLVSISSSSLKVKENQTRTFPTAQESPPVMIGPQLPEPKPARKKSALPPVPRFEETESKPSVMELEISKQETLNKFLMEIKGAEFDDYSDKADKAKMEIEGNKEDVELKAAKLDFKESINDEPERKPLEVEKRESEPKEPVQVQPKPEPIKEKPDSTQPKREAPKENPLVQQNPPPKALTPNTEKPVFQKPDFKLNLDLINNMYKQQINPKKDTPTPKKSEVSTVSNEKVLIPLMKKDPVNNSNNKLNEEYDPAKPNDYEALLNERFEKERKQREAERKSKMDIEETRLNESRGEGGGGSVQNQGNKGNNVMAAKGTKLVSPKSTTTLFNL